MHTEYPAEYQIVVAPTDHPAPRLDAFLATRLDDLSRARIQQLIADGRITVNGIVAKKRRPLEAGDRILIRIPAVTTPATPVAEDIPLSILFEDRDIIVIDKPPGLVVHPAPGHGNGTLVNALLHHCGDLGGIGGERRPGVVHRLDKDTSGVMVAAKNEAAFLGLGRQFRQRSVEKDYLAIVHRVPTPAQGRIDAALARHPRDRQRFAVTQHGGRHAVTDYRLRDVLGDASLLDLRIATGRTHQIRVHLAWRGHPIIGDTRYGGKRQLADGTVVARQMLHAHRLQFRHPVSDAIIALEAPVPADMQALLERLRSIPSNCRN